MKTTLPDLGTLLKPAKRCDLFADPAWYIWCGTMVKANDNKYHLFFSRWKRELGHYAWISHSEIGYAVADTPMGPYRFVKLVLTGRKGTDFWDSGTIHNPSCLYRDGKFYLYYMATRENANLKQPTDMNDPQWWIARNTQRIGLAVTSDPTKEWERFDAPIIDVARDPGAFDSLMMANPAFTFTPEGKILMIYKGVEIKGERGGRVRYGSAIADRPEGPFRRVATGLFESSAEADKDTWMLIEDPCLFRLGDTYCAVVRDFEGRFSGEKAGLAFFISENGHNWRSAENARVLGNRFQWDDGGVSDTHLERPFVYVENDKPVVLFGSMDIHEPVRRGGAANLHISF